MTIEINEKLLQRFKMANPSEIIVAPTKFDSPQSTFVLSDDFCPIGLLKMFPADPNAMCGTPFFPVETNHKVSDQEKP